jgi:predicted Na+-dependent transporter
VKTLRTLSNTQQSMMMKKPVKSIGLFALLSVLLCNTAAAYRQCPAEAYVKSQNSGYATTIAFANSSTHTSMVYWLDYNGARVLYSTLEPNMTFKISTYLNHPWVVTDAEDNCVAVHFPDSKKRTIWIKR